MRTHDSYLRYASNDFFLIHEERFGLGCLRRLLLQKVGGDAQHFGELESADFQFFADWGWVGCELMSKVLLFLKYANEY